jgi:predicted PurR-regulated permease PerM
MSDLNSSTTNDPSYSNQRIIDLTIQLAVGAVFVIASFRILHPFIDLIVAGGVIAIAVYPLFVKTVDRLGGRRKLAVALFALVGIGILVVPVIMASSSLFESGQALSEQASEGTFKVPPPPSGVRDWPVVGAKIHGLWQTASANLESFLNTYNDQVMSVLHGLVATVANVGVQVLKFIFCVLIAAIFLANAESCAAGLGTFSTRLFGEARGRELNQLAAQTVRSVATGVLGVAFVQAFLAGVGMAVADVPWVGVWSLAVLLLAIMQLPPLVILLPVAIWVFGSADNQIVAWGFLVWAILVGVSDTVLKPMFLGRGVDIPMIVILLGAIGGAILSGVMGLFVGAVILALAYRLLVEWLNYAPEEPPAASPEEAQ